MIHSSINIHIEILNYNFEYSIKQLKQVPRARLIFCCAITVRDWDQEYDISIVIVVALKTMSILPRNCESLFSLHARMSKQLRKRLALIPRRWTFA